MKRLKFILTSIALITVFSSQAKMIIETCIEQHVDNTNCFKVHITIIDDDPTYGRVLVSEGSAWVGSDCAKNGHKEMPNSTTGCPPVQLDGNILAYTLNGSPHCLNESLNNPEDAAACIASINDLISRVGTTANKGVIGSSNVAALTIFPNPATSHITVATRFENVTGTANFYLYDMAGKEILSTHIQNPGAARFTLSLKDIASGNYNVIIKTDKQILGSKKITVQ